MTHTAADANPIAFQSACSRWPWLLAAAGVFVLGVAMRAWVHFSHTLPGGIDAAYYPLQARTLLEQGRLMYNDLPLIFVIDAAVARLCMLVAGMGIADATLLASQVVDCVSQPLAGLAIVGLGYAFAGGRRWAIPGAAAAAMLATVSLPPMRMVSDFEKNALGLAFMAWAMWAAHRAIGASAGRRVRAWAMVVVWAALAALTHVGAVGATIITLAATVGAAALLGGRLTFRRALVWGASGFVTAGVLLAAVAAADMDRARHLVSVPAALVKHPAIDGLVRMVREGPRARPKGPDTNPRPDRDFGPGPGGPPPDFIMDGPPDGPGFTGPDDGRASLPDARRQTDDRPDAPGAGVGGRPRSGPGPGRGGMKGADPVSLFTVLAVYAAVPLGLCTLGWRRRSVTLADAAVVTGAGIGALLLACPLLNGEYFSRFVLMSPVPASVVAAFVMCGAATRAGRAAGVVLALGAAALAIVPVVRGSPQIVRVQVPDAAVEELRSLAKFAPDARGAGHTLVVAPHGLQYWAGHFMHAAGRLDRIPDGAMEKYERVFILRPRGQMGMGPGGGGLPPGSGSRFPGPGGRDHPLGPPGGPPRMGPRGGPRVQVPPNARKVFEGEHFTLWEVPGAVAPDSTLGNRVHPESGD